MPRRSSSVQLELAELIGSRKTQSLATENGRAGLRIAPRSAEPAQGPISLRIRLVPLRSSHAYLLATLPNRAESGIALSIPNGRVL